MKYPDLSEISVGDHVWWDEGHVVGYIQEIIESKESLKAWGITVPSIMISPLHPFDPSDSCVQNEVTQLADEGVAKLSPFEESLFTQAINTAHQENKIPLNSTEYLVSFIVEGGLAKEWEITFPKKKASAIVPYNTNEKP